MSVQAITWAMQQRLPGTQKSILVALANYADVDGGHCFPGQDRLCFDTGWCRMTLHRGLKELEKAGLISTTRRRRQNGSWTSTDYTLHLSHHVTDSHVTHSVQPCNTETHGPCNTELPPYPSENYPSENPSDSPIVPVANQTEKQKRVCREERVVQLLQTKLSRETAEALVEHRRAVVKKPLTERAAEGLLRAFDQAAAFATPEECADCMITNGWQGFKAEWMGSRLNGRRISATTQASIKIMEEFRERQRLGRRGICDQSSLDLGGDLPESGSRAGNLSEPANQVIRRATEAISWKGS